jgi:Fe-S-cluster containining protein
MKLPDLVQITRKDRVSEEEFYPAVNAMYEQIWERLLPAQVLTDGLSHTVANNVLTSGDAPVPDCQTCGACCAAVVCVGVRPGEDVESGKYWDVTAGELVVDRYLKREPESFRCASLAGKIGERVSCTIYESRPAICRHFEAGSDRCHALRRAYGLEPFLSLMEMAAANAKLRERRSAEPPQGTIRNAKIEADAESGALQIKALMWDGSLRPIHRYDPAAESWFQFEFEGLTIEQANELIGRRGGKRKRPANRPET